MLKGGYLCKNRSIRGEGKGTSDPCSWCFFRLSGAVRDDTDGGAVQPHEVSHLAEPILVNVNDPVIPLVGKESRNRVDPTT